MSAVEGKTRTPGIYRRGDSYTFRVTDKRTGKSYRGTARTLEEAKAKRAKLVTQLDEQGSIERSKLTFRSYAEQWVDTYQGRTRKRIRPETLVDYRKVIERHAVPFFRDRRMVEIETRDVKAYIAAMQKRTRTVDNAERPISANTVRLAVAPVKALFATALEEGVIRANPCLGARVTHSEEIEEDDQPDKALTEDELRRLLSKIADPEHRLLFEFLAQTGLRIGELLALRWGDVDLGKRHVKVRRRFYRGGFAPPKSRYGKRDVPLTAAMAQRLWVRRSELRGGQPQDCDPLFSTWVPRRPWIDGPEGEAGLRMLDRGNLYARVLKPAAKAAGVPWCGFHTFRHTCATTLFNHGMNAKQVQIWLGHSDPGFTMRTYIHLMSDDLIAPDFLDQLTGGGNGSPNGSQTSRNRKPLGESDDPAAALG